MTNDENNQNEEVNKPDEQNAEHSDYMPKVESEEQETKEEDTDEQPDTETEDVAIEQSEESEQKQYGFERNQKEF